MAPTTTTLQSRRVAERLAYCPACRGVLPFDEVRWRASPLGPLGLPGRERVGFVCRRCGVLHRLTDPAAADRRRAGRYFVYGLAAGAVPLAAGLLSVALGPGHPAMGRVAALALGALPALALLCLARGFRLRARAGRYERLESYELQELARRLCPGMMRSDVEAELFRRGWRMGKIRTLLDGLVPATTAGA